jgi:hypothetical protein
MHTQLCYFGQGRTAALLVVELARGVEPKEIADALWTAVSKANAIVPSYSAVTHNAVIIVQPEIHGELPVTNKGNVQRNLVEKVFHLDLTSENPTVHPDRGVHLPNVLGEALLSELNEQDWDSLDITAGSKGGAVPPFMVKQFHAYFIAMIAIIVMHMCGARGEDQYANFLVKAKTEPEFLRGLPRGAQLFALPTFIILMGVGDYKGLGKGLSGSVLSAVWRDMGRPLLLYLFLRYVLPAIAGELLHPYYGTGAGGHVTFTWIFLFMFYARFASQLIVRVCRLPRWAPAVIALAVHFGCFGGDMTCPSPLARSYRLVGYVPTVLNCPRFSVYYPFYAVAPLLVSEAALLSSRLAPKAVQATAALLLAGMVCWAMGAFNLDTSMMSLATYGCRGEKPNSDCEATWSLPDFAEDLVTLLGCALSVVLLLIACPTKATFASAIGACACVRLSAVSGHRSAVSEWCLQWRQWACRLIGLNCQRQWLLAAGDGAASLVCPWRHGERAQSCCPSAPCIPLMCVPLCVRCFLTGQRSLVALIVHLYAIYALTPPLQVRRIGDSRCSLSRCSLVYCSAFEVAWVASQGGYL